MLQRGMSRMAGAVVCLVLGGWMAPGAAQADPTDSPGVTVSGASADGGETAAPVLTTPDASPTAGTQDEEEMVDSPDVAPDDSRNTWALIGAGAVALVAAAVVLIKK